MINTPSEAFITAFSRPSTLNFYVLLSWDFEIIFWFFFRSPKFSSYKIWKLRNSSYKLRRFSSYDDIRRKSKALAMNNVPLKLHALLPAPHAVTSRSLTSYHGRRARRKSRDMAAANERLLIGHVIVARSRWSIIPYLGSHVIQFTLFGGVTWYTPALWFVDSGHVTRGVWRQQAGAVHSAHFTFHISDSVVVRVFDHAFCTCVPDSPLHVIYKGTHICHHLFISQSILCIPILYRWNYNVYCRYMGGGQPSFFSPHSPVLCKWKFR